MNILITGGLGFIGSHVAERFLIRGDKVYIVERNDFLQREGSKQYYNYHYLRDKYDKTQLILRAGYIEKFIPVYDIKDLDVIVHCAAQTAVTTSLEDPRYDARVNVFGTLNVLEIARDRDAKVIFTSTNKVYGDNVNKIAIRERHTRYDFDAPRGYAIDETFPIDLCGHSPYGCSKLAADLYVQDYRHTYGLHTHVLRMSCIYGERQFGTEDQGWVAHFVQNVLREEPITIYGDGKQVRDVLYVGDLVDLIEMMAGSTYSGVFNVGGGPQNTVSLLELLDMLENITGKDITLKWEDWRLMDQKVYISNISKARRFFKWEPKVSPREGIEKLVKWTNERSV